MKVQKAAQHKSFIGDFYCPEEYLIIEMDGEVHLNPLAEEKDRKRKEVLEEMGFCVLRFENKMVFESLDSVLREIKDNFR